MRHRMHYLKQVRGTGERQAFMFFRFPGIFHLIEIHDAISPKDSLQAHACDFTAQLRTIKELRILRFPAKTVLSSCTREQYHRRHGQSQHNGAARTATEAHEGA
jgi:hypothetical protein